MSSWSIAQANLTSVGVLGFMFGFLASRVKSDVRIPEAIYQFICYLESALKVATL